MVLHPSLCDIVTLLSSFPKRNSSYSVVREPAAAVAPARTSHVLVGRARAERAERKPGSFAGSMSDTAVSPVVGPRVRRRLVSHIDVFAWFGVSEK